MLFCCLWRNVETSCHKHYAVLSRHQQTPPLTISEVSQRSGTRVTNYQITAALVYWYNESELSLETFLSWQHVIKTHLLINEIAYHLSRNFASSCNLVIIISFASHKTVGPTASY